MQAIVLESNGVTFRDDYAPRQRSGEVPIRVLKAGVCETDLQLVQGYMGFQGILGHEFVGVAELGRFAGQRVCGEINCPCGTCDDCRSGRGNHCPHRTVLGILNRDGAFAEQVWLPESCLHPVPDEVTTDEAVFVEPLAAAFQIPAQLDLSRFRKMVVLGDGRLGNLCSQVLASLGHRITCVGKHEHKLERLRRRGIEVALLGDIDDTRFADLVVDCTGSASGFTTACRLVRPRGTVVLKTTVAGDAGPNLAPVVIDEIQLIGSRCGPFLPALNALKNHQIEVDSLITSRFPLARGIEALQHAKQKDQLKVLIEIS